MFSVIDTSATCGTVSVIATECGSQSGAGQGGRYGTEISEPDPVIAEAIADRLHRSGHAVEVTRRGWR